MMYLRDLLRLGIALLNASFATLPQRVSYEWNGEAASARTQSSFVDFFAGIQTLAATEVAENSGWLDYTNVGRPFCMLFIQAQGTGQRNVEVLIEHARLFDGQLLKTTVERFVNLAEVDYSPKQLVWNLPLEKSIGPFMRVKSITNNGDMTITAQALGPASAQPVDPNDIPVLDYEVIEGDVPHE